MREGVLYVPVCDNTLTITLYELKLQHGEKTPLSCHAKRQILDSWLRKIEAVHNTTFIFYFGGEIALMSKPQAMRTYIEQQ